MVDGDDRGPGSTRKALVLLILTTTMIIPWSLTTVHSSNTTQEREMKEPMPKQQPEAERAPTPTVLWKYQTGYRIEHSSPVVADLLGDGKLEVVIGSQDHNVYCLNGSTGSKVWNYTTGHWVDSSPIVADLLGDGKLEVVIGSQDHNVYCLNGSTGEKLWNYTTAGAVLSSAAVADLVGDGKLEVVVGSFDCNVYCLNGTTGTMLWSQSTGSWITSSPAVADLVGDGKLEVVIGSSDRNVYCLNGSTGKVLWSRDTGSWISPSLAVADLVGDGKLEVVVGSSDHKVYCLNGTTGNILWTHDTGALVDTSPIVADLLGDHKLEVVVGSQGGNVSCLDGSTGDVLWSDKPGIWGAYSSPVVADLLGEGIPEVLVGSEDGLYCLNGVRGDKLWSYETAGAVFSSPAVADLVDDDKVELIVASGHGFIYCMAPPDTTPPATIIDLAASGSTNTSITLTWTAPGDNGMVGKATGYLLKYSTSGRITASNWTSAATYSQSWAPAKNGSTETHVIAGLSSGTTYWFAIEAYDKVANHGGVSNSPSATTVTVTGGDGDAADGSLVIIVAGVVVLPAMTTAIVVVFARKRGARTAIMEDKESVTLAKIKSRREDDSNQLATSPVALGTARGGKINADELFLAGTTLKVYWSLLSKRPDSAGFREIQKELGFSSPSSALYQLDKLVRLGLLEKDAMGDYGVRRIVKVGLLSNFSYIGKYSVPKNAVYGCMTLLINSICVVLLMAVGLSPIAYLALLPGVFASIVFFYEASKAWKYKRKVFEIADDRSKRRGVKERT